ncbi:MAG TPA: VIT1/CCC1 transporter family protein, partial [Steroidobacteraceae bacterium]|nr:VIT1/CCC1 transporter family protein [Steroidobacteraceae bacterium]
MSDPHESWREEKRSAWLYRVVAECEHGTPRAALFNELAQAAEAQADIWLNAIIQKGGPAPGPFHPDLRTRVVARLTRTFKPRAMRGVLTAMKVRGMALYTHRPPHAMPTRVDDIGKRHQSGAAGNALRAGVFGVNDGLVSNAALIYGVAGAAQEPSVIVLTGVAGLLAGAFSMAAGEYISMRVQREVFERLIHLEAHEIGSDHVGEREELADLYRRKGISPELADRLADELMRDPETALETHAREELGLDPQEGLGSPWAAAGSSFVTFAAGALIPLIPFWFGSGSGVVVASAILSILAL